jgi:hypothetical protein
MVDLQLRRLPGMEGVEGEGTSPRLMASLGHLNHRVGRSSSAGQEGMSGITRRATDHGEPIRS